MALLDNNASGLAVIDRPAGTRRDSFSFMTTYDYTKKYKPDMIAELYYAFGDENIATVFEALGMTGTYASDQVKHAELQRLHNRISDVTFSGTDTFTSTVPHNAQVNMMVLISNGTRNYQGYVTAITSDTVFVAKSIEAAGFAGIGTTVDVTIDFSSSWNKGTGQFETGNTWDPVFYENQSQIIKLRYDEAESDMAHDIWFDTPEGPRWTNTDIERANTMFDNEIVLTQWVSRQVEPGSPAAAAGAPIGLKGIIQQVEERGNVFNGYIETKEDLQDFALRITENGIKAKNYLILCDLEQMNRFNDLAASISPSSVNQYGTFPNGEDMCIKLDFKGIMVSGITFWFKHWSALNNVTLLSGKRFDTTGFNFVAFPMGTEMIKDGDGNKFKAPYLKTLYRAKGDVNRRRKVEVFGHGGTPQIEDKMTISYLSETTVQVIGANGWFVGSKSDTGYDYDTP